MADKFATFKPDGTLSLRLIKGLHDIPKGAIPVDEPLWQRLLNESDGIWRLVDGKIVKEPLPVVELPPPTREEVEALRLRAYADPLTGSDRYFAEAQRMQVMNESGWEAIRAAGVKRFEDIQQEFPWSESEPVAP
jgi:predicted DNA-binding protein (UPF0251 family)